MRSSPVLILLILALSPSARAEEPASPEAATPSSEAATPSSEAATPSPELLALQAAARAYPQDYVTQVALARAADASAWTELAVGAWDAAFTVSGGNLESSLGRALALLADGRIADARAAAAAATLAFPQSTEALGTWAWTLRQQAALLPGTYGLVAAERAYVRALRLRPQAETRCGLAWTRTALGAPVLAREDFVALLGEDSGAPCAVEGTAATKPMIRFGGGFNLTGSFYQDHDTNLGGFNALLSGNISLFDLAFASIHGRLLGIAYDAGSGTQDYEQQELWGRVGVSHGGHGGQVLVGAVDTSSSSTTVPVVAAQGWTTFGPTLRLEGAWSGYDDGDALKAGAALRVPITSFLSLDGGGDLTGLVTDTGSSDPSLSGHLSAIVRAGPLTLQPGFRAGQEQRPVRMDEPSIWNTTDQLEASAFLRGAVALNPHLDLSFGYEVLRLQPDDGSDVRHTHLLSLGLSASGSGGLRK